MVTDETLTLPIWAGLRAGPKAKASTGELNVAFHGDRKSARQKAAVLATKRRAAAMKPRVLDAIERPKAIAKAALEKHVELWEILVTKDHHEDVAYVAYMFSCSWHPSGAVVLTHGDRIVSAGSLDVLEYPHRDPARKPPEPKGPTAAQVRALVAAAKTRAKKNPKTLSDDASISLPGWAGFSSRPTQKPSKGDVLVSLVDGAAAGPEQQAAYRQTVRHATRMQDLVLEAIAESFAMLTKNAVDFTFEGNVDRAALRGLVDLRGIHVHRASRDDVAYVGYELGCAWDREHGLGVLTHIDRVVSLGHADESFLGWIAERDRKKKRKTSSARG